MYNAWADVFGAHTVAIFMGIACGVIWLIECAFVIKVMHKYRIFPDNPILFWPVNENDITWGGIRWRDSSADYGFAIILSMFQSMILTLLWLAFIAFPPSLVVFVGYMWYWFSVHWPRVHRAVQKRDKSYV